MRFYFILILIILSSLMTGLTGCSLSLGQSDVTEQPTIPSIRIVAPLANAAYRPGVMVNIQALISNTDAVRAEFLIDNNVIATQQTPTDQPTFSLTQSWQAAGLGTHTITLILYRADGTNLEPVTLPIMVLDIQPTEDVDMGIIATVPPTNTVIPEQQEEQAVEPTDVPTEPPVATDVPTEAPAAISDTVIATFNNGVNVRSGPSRENTTVVGTFAANQSAEVLATNADGTWIKIQMDSGFGWVLAAYAEIQGDLNSLPKE